MRIQKDHACIDGIFKLNVLSSFLSVSILHFSSISSRCAFSYVVLIQAWLTSSLEQSWVNKVDRVMDIQVPSKERSMEISPFVLSVVSCFWNWQASSVFRETSWEGSARFVEPKTEQSGKQQVTQLSSQVDLEHVLVNRNLIFYCLMLLSDRYCAY